jgi:hypothetical protein
MVRRKAASIWTAFDGLHPGDGQRPAFRGAFNNQATYQAFLDFNGDGIINSGDNPCRGQSLGDTWPLHRAL